jgi:hypothetical protein
LRGVRLLSAHSHFFRSSGIPHRLPVGRSVDGVGTVSRKAQIGAMAYANGCIAELVVPPSLLPCSSPSTPRCLKSVRSRSDASRSQTNWSGETTSSSIAYSRWTVPSPSTCGLRRAPPATRPAHGVQPPRAAGGQRTRRLGAQRRRSRGLPSPPARRGRRTPHRWPRTTRPRSLRTPSRRRQSARSPSWSADRPRLVRLVLPHASRKMSLDLVGGVQEIPSQEMSPGPCSCGRRW